MSFRATVFCQKKNTGVVPDSDVATYRRPGERASPTWAVLRYLPGCSSIANHDGAWSGRGTAHGVPTKMSTSAAPEAKAARAREEARKEGMR